MKANYDVFIAYSARDEPLARCLQRIAGSLLGIKSTRKRELNDRVFLSEHSVPKGVDWLEATEDAIAGARAMIVLLTPNSVYSSWVHYEIGGAKLVQKLGQGSDGPQLFLLLAGGLKQEDFPTDMSSVPVYLRSQFCTVDTDENLEGLVRALGVRLECEESVGRVCKGVHCKTLRELAEEWVAGWGYTCMGRNVVRIGTSPYVFEKLIKAHATKHLLVAGQNLHFLLADEQRDGLQKVLLEELRQRPDLDVRILICDYGYEPFRASWDLLMGRDGVYVKHLIEVTSNLRALHEKCRSPGVDPPIKGTFAARVTKVLPISATFVNANDDGTEGDAVIRPVLAAEPRQRAAFCVSAPGPQKDIYYYYWLIFNRLWDDLGGSTQCISELHVPAAVPKRRPRSKPVDS